MNRDVVSLLVAVALIVLTFGLLRLWQQRKPGHSAELVRKAAHMLSGAIAAAFPWLFQSTWPGVALCSIALLAMLAMRVVPVLRQTYGRVTGSVDRHTWGEFYFPAAVACVWVLSERDPILFVVPVLLLTFGDAAAALVGVAFGRHKFRTSEGQKSVEGSVAFLAVGTAATFVALSILAPDIDIVKVALIATLLACLLMIFEAVAWRGMDNILLPVLAFVLLRIYLKLDAAELGVRLAVLSVIVVLLISIRGRRTMTGEGLLAASLVLYSTWALGGWEWFALPAIIVLATPWLPRDPNVPNISIHGVFPVVALSVAGVTLLITHVLTGANFWPPYVATFTASLSVVACIQLHARLDRVPTVGVLTTGVGAGVVLVAVPGAIIVGTSLQGALNLLVISLASTSVACCAFIPAFYRIAGETRLWLMRGVAVSIGSACATTLDMILTTSP